MEWQAVVLALQILMLAIGWFLFQQARGELSAHAAQTPVLGEVRALQRSIKQLLEELAQTSDRASNQLERRCQEARDMVAALERRMDQLAAAERSIAPVDPPADNAVAIISGGSPRLAARVNRSERTEFGQEYATIAHSGHVAAAHSGLGPTMLPTLPDSRTSRQQVYALADRGIGHSDIAQTTGLSEGEVETLLALRARRDP